MIISINNAVLATQIFSAIFVALLLLSIRRQKGFAGLSVAVTQELKGFAILAIVLSHIGYFLVSDHRFLFPLTIAAGLGVNLFLFLSGYGIATSAISKPLSVWQFYRHRLLKIYTPFWIVVVIFFALDFLIGHKTYGLGYMFQSIIGFFPHADLWTDLNSPLWYFTLIIFYYLLFPLVFFRKYPCPSAVILYLAGYLIVRAEPSILDNVMHLYRIHLFAFPLGVLAAGLVSKYPGSRPQLVIQKLTEKFKDYKLANKIGYWLLMIFFSWLFVYAMRHSSIGGERWLEEATSLLTGAILIILFLIKKFEIKFFYWFGFFSYEIYLFHWPLMARFDIFYCFTPAWLATLLYLGLFLLLGWGMRKLLSKSK
ncbi:MAG: acyltransferase [Candidatus Falkowbacteria bacterium]|nr:MAG: acyltransferase [Candidatus Falkowbacteria bacterium]